jgi:3-hydroxyacyl-CoA dehydrogenase/enoyl-CoA hydratase/3-hydroxybutyryl-CoA epimerase
LKEGARVEVVDAAMQAFGFPVGPFVLYDEVGLEVAQHAGETVARAFGDRIPAASVVGDLVARGETGRKVGRGFYVWPAGRRLPLLAGPRRSANPFVYGSAPRRAFSEREIQERLVLVFVNEAIRCLQERVIQSPADGDLGAVLGLGFPPFRGGPFHYADSLGVDALRARLEALAREHGARYAPTETTLRGSTFFREQL